MTLKIACPTYLSKVKSTIFSEPVSSDLFSFTNQVFSLQSIINTVTMTAKAKSDTITLKISGVALSPFVSIFMRRTAL